VTLDTGTKLGRYEIRSKIGEGGMGEVYLAHDIKLDRKVALKILPPELASNQDRIRRFTQEARAAAALNHPNIAHIYEIGESESANFIAMEFIDGFTLRELIHGKQTELAKLLRYLQHVAEGLAKAHAAAIVHRDLKPDNIMITRDGHAKILDFGLAKLIEPQQISGSGSSEVATAIMKQHSTPGAILGTVGYMSPEQAQGKTNEIDQRSDIFSFGCILYEAITRRKAFEGKDAVESLNKIIRGPVAPLVELNPDAPVDLQRIVRRCLAKDADERYQTIKEVAIELKEIRREMSGAGVHTTVPPPKGETESVSTDRAGGAQGGRLPNSLAGESMARESSAEYIVSGIKQHKVAAIGFAVVFAAVVVALAFYFHARATEVAIESIAVVPFVNQSNDPASDWVSDGLTESIINSLTQLPNLKVIARSSVFRYKGKENDPLAIGKELGVRAVLTGRVIQRGDSLNISVELLDVRDNKQLWGDQYSRQVSDLLSVQRDIAREITSNLRPKISGTEQLAARQTTQNSDAYQLYLKGRYYWNKFTPADHQRSIDYFKQAIEKDPGYALAYVGLCDAYGASSTNGWIPSYEGYPKAIAAARKALELDENLAEAHTSYGALTMFYNLDWSTAEREYKRAIELNPNYPLSYELYSYLLTAMRRPDEAINMAKRGLETDPLSVLLSDDISSAYYFARRYDESISQTKKSLEMEPNRSAAHVGLGATYQQKGMYNEAIKEYDTAIGEIGRIPGALALLGYTYAVQGRKAEALKLLDELTREKSGSPYDLATIYTGLGQKDDAITQLNKAYEERAGWIIYLRVEPLFDPLRHDPRFTELVDRLRLPQ
jgi:serine/threonine-protein kinase